MTKPKHWAIEGQELEEHLAADCELTIIDPAVQTYEYFTQEERELMAQFPDDNLEYDEVLTWPLESCSTEPNLSAGYDGVKQVGKPYRTARYWCLRVKYV